MSEGLKYTVDIVLCIDATGSMKPVIGKVKEKAIDFYEDLQNSMSEKGRFINELQVKVIVFRDFFVDGPYAFQKSPVYSLPNDKVQFSNFINDIYADGGGDDPENGLEALAVAMKSAWNKDGDKRRQIIVLWTDTTAHPLEKGANSGLSLYPKGIPNNFNDLTDAWRNQNIIDQNGKRLILFTPDMYPWSDIQKFWDVVVHYPSRAGHGLDDLNYKTIIDAIVNSIY